MPAAPSSRCRGVSCTQCVVKGVTPPNQKGSDSERTMALVTTTDTGSHPLISTLLSEWKDAGVIAAVIADPADTDCNTIGFDAGDTDRLKDVNSDISQGIANTLNRLHGVDGFEWKVTGKESEGVVAFNRKANGKVKMTPDVKKDGKVIRKGSKMRAAGIVLRPMSEAKLEKLAEKESAAK
jgi:hypothetical protein